MKKNLLKIAIATLNTNDSESIPQLQCTYLGKVADITLIQPYGLTSRPPEDYQSLITMMSQQGAESARLGIASCPLLRKKNLKPGETVLENMLSGAFFYLKEDGDLEIIIPKNITQTSKNITLTADNVTMTMETVNATTKAISLDASSQNITITKVNALSVTATSATLSIPSISITGNISLTGNLTTKGNLVTTGNLTTTGDITTTGNVSNTGTLKNNGTSVGSTHKHSGVTTGAGNTGNPV